MTRPSPPEQAIRVVLVDDAEDVRRVLRTALRYRGNFDVVGEAPDGAEAVRLALALRPDVVVLDLGLPDIAGQEVLVRIRETAPETKIVVFSGMEAADHAWVAQRVEGYVLKDADLDYLVRLLETVARESSQQARIGLPEELSSVATARRFVEETLSSWSLGQLSSDALVVVSELVTNAITHARCPCTVQLSLTPTVLRVSVVDAGVGAPEPRPRSSTREGGRGLYMVDALASAWGIEAVPDGGKIVWAELPRWAPDSLSHA